ncbi:hypothetical protein [Methylobacterium oxalidis]|uniref:Uncharacterized protein n=1 Tax=Methylobacterium oxalidis TaxID=944322 RepID=A0A512JC58_9HYPH|nr:hypothetical protein [Methylobacterium oxalidis]GEP07485.1 hypothetical protein MOX02_55230 [Methylobacterium oxalidis]GJE35443.1 hypothetical protein LDDCCGHA_5661 [Methylobacterium oxalidis]GLS66050.1 hypothetical protein GCM10007888_44320 [Methylobacterium oxalidis]
MNNEILIIVLAVATLALVIGAALWMRARVAQSKGDPKRSAFTQRHGEAPRPNRPGTEH